MKKLYLSNSHDFEQLTLQGGSADWIQVDGRGGLLCGNRTTRAALAEHTINSPRGTASLWIYALDDLANAPWSPTWVDACHPGHRNYPFLCDSPAADLGFQAENATFAWNWDNDWYPQFYAKFHSGKIYPDAFDEVTGAKAFVGAGHWAIRRQTWYYLGLTWDKLNNDYRLFINGHCVARSDARAAMAFQPAGSVVFVGHTAYLVAGICFLDEVSDAAALQQDYLAGGGNPSSAVNAELRRHYLGEGNPPARTFDDTNWNLSVNLTLREPGQAENLYVQGPLDAPRITAEGLRITTPMQRQTLGVTPGWSTMAATLGRKDVNSDALTPSGFFDKYSAGALAGVSAERLAPADTFRAGEPRDMEQVYVWLREWLEGDIHVEYEFMPLRQEGLSLLILQATGMHREDFMIDDPPRTNGSMRTVCWENVRNYHWEYYRNILDCRRDLASHVLVKNPRSLPIAMGYQKPLQLNKWHQLVFHQDGACLTGSIDGETVLEARDDPFFGQGPIYNSGRVALRSMLRTDIVIKNMKIWNRRAPMEVLYHRKH
jgi:hypothetical protein